MSFYFVLLGRNSETAPMENLFGTEETVNPAITTHEILLLTCWPGRTDHSPRPG